MSGLAKYLLHKGYTVCGSDKRKSSTTIELEKLGSKIYYNHCAKNLDGSDFVVYTSAISDDNEELVYARQMGIPIIKRSQLLGEILSGYKRSIAIAGCHGKTTSTAMLYEIMRSAGQNPTLFLGGEYGEQGNFNLGNGDLAIAEACEYKKSFLDINPKVAVVLNVDNDHLDSYSGMKDVVASFKSFVGDRLAVINADDNYLNEISNCTTVTFGIKNLSTYYARGVKSTEKGISFTACAYAKPYGKINLSLSGAHNVYNALSAFATADLLGVPFAHIKRGLEKFKGVSRRNELLGEKDGLSYYADYAHHPSEIKASLGAFAERGNDFITVFQPHTYSRTRLLLNDFVEALSVAKNLIIYKTYPAREKFDKSGSAKSLANAINEKAQICIYAHTGKELERAIQSLSKGKKRIIFIGAGDIYEISKGLLKGSKKSAKN